GVGRRRRASDQQHRDDRRLGRGLGRPLRQKRQARRQVDGERDRDGPAGSAASRRLHPRHRPFASVRPKGRALAAISWPPYGGSGPSFGAARLLGGWTTGPSTLVATPVT